MSFFRGFRKSDPVVAATAEPPAAAPAAPAAAPAATPPEAEAAPAAVPPTAAPPAATVPAKVDEENIKITVEDEPEIDPVRTELEGEVRVRDAKIIALEKARQEKREQLMGLEKELEKERLTQMTEALVHKIESERIKRQTAHAEDRLQALEQDMQDKAAIHEYANLIKGVAPKGGVDSQYVMKLQAQLQKAVKKMEATTTQMKELETQSRETVDQLTAEITQLITERCRTELELRKQMEVLDEQKREMQHEYEERIRQNLKTLEALRAKAVNQTTIDELEAELRETETKLEDLARIHEKQAQSIEQLNKSLASQGDM